MGINDLPGAWGQFGVTASQPASGFAQASLLLHLQAKPGLVPVRPKLRTAHALPIAGAGPPLRPVGRDVSIHPDPPHVVAYALDEAKYLHAIT